VFTALVALAGCESAADQQPRSAPMPDYSRKRSAQSANSAAWQAAQRHTPSRGFGVGESTISTHTGASWIQRMVDGRGGADRGGGFADFSAAGFFLVAMFRMAA
jgi:hypothetical protein